MANRISDVSSNTDTSHLPGQGLQRKAQRQAQQKHTPDIEGRAGRSRRVAKRRVATKGR